MKEYKDLKEAQAELGHISFAQAFSFKDCPVCGYGLKLIASYFDRDGHQIPIYKCGGHGHFVFYR